MLEPGKYYNLEVRDINDSGAFLLTGTEGDKAILLPGAQIPPDTHSGDIISVFLYTDSEDRLIATTLRPVAAAGEFALLRVVAVNNIGAFADMGLPKDLLIPFKEMKGDLRVGQTVLVHIYHDKSSGRLAGSTIINKFLRNDPSELKPGTEVDAFIAEKTDTGFRVIVNNLYWGMIYADSMLKPLIPGNHIKAYVMKVRDDLRIDLSMRRPGFSEIDEASQNLLARLVDAGGHLPYNDDSDPAEIRKVFSISKKTFKRAAGVLMKEGRIKINEAGLHFIR
jgi:predicted RNA-binding protein (virulence factor B family)